LFKVTSTFIESRLEPILILKLLSLNQITEIISQLLVLIWSAAAGNINLVNAPTHTSSSLNSSNNSAPHNLSMSGKYFYL
jgi:hypothetical protein